MRNSVGIAAIIQARMTSTRLPGKVLKVLGHGTVLSHMIHRVNQSKLIEKLIIATSRNCEDDPIENLCRELSVSCFRGDECDVLGRMYLAAEEYKCETIVRLTGDCPLIDPDIIDDVIQLYTSGEFEYVSNCNKRSFPDGLDVEVFSFSALQEANDKAVAPELREHVTQYIRNSRPDLGGREFLSAQFVYQSDFSHIRWTLDTTKDYLIIKELIDRLPNNYRWLDALSIATKYPKLLGDRSGVIELIGACLGDADTLFVWLNEPDCLCNKRNTKSDVNYTDHIQWLTLKLSQSNCRIWMIKIDNTIVGQVRIDCVADTTFIDIYIDENHRRRNIAFKAINRALYLYTSTFSGISIEANIRRKNTASLKLFEQLGFIYIGQEKDYCKLVKSSKNNE